MSKIRDFTASYNQKNILGPVSQVGGIPTGAIIESGSNVNGRYTKYANGDMVCTAHLVFGTTVKGGHGSIFISPTLVWTFPAQFVNTPSISGNPINWAACWVGYGGVNITSNIDAHLALFSGVSIDTGGTSLAAPVTATGRWF